MGNCESQFCGADSDYRDSFDLTENGDTITVYLDELKKHPHTMKFIFENKVMIIGLTGNILQLWREKAQRNLSKERID